MKRRAITDMKRRAFLARAGMAAGGVIAMPLILPRAWAGASTIVDVSGDKRIELSNASFARPFNIGTWSRLRIGIRFAMNGTSALGSTPVLAVGCCSGSSNQIFDATTTNFIGMRTKATTWTNTGGSYFTVNNDKWQPAKRVGSTWTDLGDMSQQNLYPSSDTSKETALIVDIAKGSPNFSVRRFYQSSTTIADVTRDALLSQVVATSPSITGHTWDQVNIAGEFSEADGTLDHVAIGWSRFEVAMQISDIFVVKMAA